MSYIFLKTRGFKDIKYDLKGSHLKVVPEKKLLKKVVTNQIGY